MKKLDIQNEIAKIKRLKSIIDLVTCELCAIIIALIIDCIVLFNLWGTDTTVPDVTGPVDTTDGEEKKDNDKDNNLVLPIIIGVVAVAAIGAVVTVIIIKKKK